MSCASHRDALASSEQRSDRPDRRGRRNLAAAALLLPLIVFALLVAALGAPSRAAAQAPPGPGQLEDGSPPTAPILPPGPWRACLLLCPSAPAPEWLAEARYFCTGPCVGLTLAEYECGPPFLLLAEWLSENGWTLCPEGAREGCCFGDPPPECAGEPLEACCLLEWCQYHRALCVCGNLEDANPKPEPSSPCDLAGSDLVNCADLDWLLGTLAPNPACGITVEMVLDAACCFLGQIKSLCDTVWTPSTGTVCDDIKACLEARIGRPLTTAELLRLMVCYGDTCNCCTETDPPSGPPTPYFNCGEFLCDRNGDGVVDCDDFKEFIEEARQLCNDGIAFTTAQILDLACEFLKKCAVDCDAFIDCLEEILCRSLTPEEVAALAACVGEPCEPDDCCSAVGASMAESYSCGATFLCRRDCENSSTCAQIMAFIAESEVHCNDGIPYDKAKRLDLICEFLEQCGEVMDDPCADLLDCVM